jgi:hypothetical protein
LVAPLAKRKTILGLGNQEPGALIGAVRTVTGQATDRLELRIAGAENGMVGDGMPAVVPNVEEWEGREVVGRQTHVPLEQQHRALRFEARL